MVVLRFQVDRLPHEPSWAGVRRVESNDAAFCALAELERPLAAVVMVDNAAAEIRWLGQLHQSATAVDKPDPHYRTRILDNVSQVAQPHRIGETDHPLSRDAAGHGKLAGPRQ